MAGSELSQLSDKILPEALKGFADAAKMIDQIATYCRGAQRKKEFDDVYKQTQGYSKDALMNVAYHVYTISTNLTKFLTLQADELSRLSVSIKSSTERLRVCKEAVGLAGFDTLESEADIPESAKAPTKYQRKAITSDVFSSPTIFSLNAVNLAPLPSEDIVSYAAPKKDKKKDKSVSSKSSSKSSSGKTTTKRKPAGATSSSKSSTSKSTKSTSRSVPNPNATSGSMSIPPPPANVAPPPPPPAANAPPPPPASSAPPPPPPGM